MYVKFVRHGTRIEPFLLKQALSYFRKTFFDEREKTTWSFSVVHIFGGGGGGGRGAFRWLVDCWQTSLVGFSVTGTPDTPENGLFQAAP